MHEYKFRRRNGFDATKARIVFEEVELQAQARTIATRHWGVHREVPWGLAAAAAGIQRIVMDKGEGWCELTSNNVTNVQPLASQKELHALGFQDDCAEVLRALGSSVKDINSSVWLACHEVGHHVDQDLAVATAFMVWHVAGPAKAVEFPNMGFGLVMSKGDAVLFDGIQPHGVRVPSKAGRAFEHVESSETLPETPEDVTVFYSVDVNLTPDLRAAMGILLVEVPPQNRTPYIDVNSQNGRSKLVER